MHKQLTINKNNPHNLKTKKLRTGKQPLVPRAAKSLIEESQLSP
jgi:hypothetical protein